MEGTVFVLALSAIGCGTAVVITFIDKVFGVFGTTKHKARLQEAQQQLQIADERGRYKDLRIVELSRQNEQLQKQLEWHGKMLDTQDQMLKRLGSDEPAGVR
jgi:TolA-binding protein